jgi:hypothetical protein
MIAMTRRRVLLGLLLASAVLVCFAGWMWIATRPRVTRERFEQVKEGMTREEVIRTVGGPPGDYSRRDDPRLWIFSSNERWRSDDGELLIGFDGAGIATEVVVLPAIPDEFNPGPPPLTERIRRWLGL